MGQILSVKNLMIQWHHSRKFMVQGWGRVNDYGSYFLARCSAVKEQLRLRNFLSASFVFIQKARDKKLSKKRWTFIGVRYI